MSKKYKLTDETISLNGATLYRIEALKDFGEIKKGDKGGFVKSENNLAHDGDAWVSDDACVYNNARVYGNARVSDNSRVYGNSLVYGNAQVYGNARMCGNARVCGNAYVYGYTYVYGNSLVYGNARVSDNAYVYDNASVSDNARVYGNVRVYGNTNVCGDAEISTGSDYIVFKNWWSSGMYFTWTRSNNMWSVGCFYGTGEELIKKAYQDNKKSGLEYERIVHYVEDVLKSENNGSK